MKQVLWSPLSTSTFLVGGGSQLTLYNYKNDKIRLVTSTDDLNVRPGSSLQCFAWCPSKNIDDLVAVGHSTGRVDLLRLNPSRYAEPGPEVSLPVRNQRSCNALSWRDSSYLAVGLDKVRNDSSLLVWDITQSLPVFSSSNTSPSTTPLTNGARTVQHHAQGELVSTVAWSSGSKNLLLTSISNRWLRLFDIRAGSTPVANLPSKVHGIAIDSFDENRFACWGDGVVSIWDLRRLTNNNGGNAASSSSTPGATTAPVLSFTEYDASGDGGVSALYNPRLPAASPLPSPLASSLSSATSTFPSPVRAASRLRTQSAGGSYSSTSTAVGTALPPYKHVVFSDARRGTIATLAKDAVCVRVWDIMEAKSYNLYSSNLQNQITPEQRSQQSNSAPAASKRSWASLAAYMPGGGEDKEKEAHPQPHIQLQRRPSSTLGLNGREWEREYLILADTKRTMPLLFPNSANTVNANAASTSSPSALSSFALVPPLPSGIAHHGSNGSDSDESSSDHLETDFEDLESYQTRLAAKIETKVLLLTNSGALSISTIRDAPKYRGSWSSRGEMVLDYGEDISPRVITDSRVGAEPEKVSVREKSRDSKGRSLSKSKSKSRSKSRSKSMPGKQQRQKTTTKAENALEKCGQVSQVLQMDISMVMRARAEKGYGLTDPLFNVSILRDFGHWAEESSTLKTPVVKKEYVKLGLGLDDLLADTWEWAANSNRLLSTPTSLIYGWDFAYTGVWGLWVGPRGVPRYRSLPTGVQSSTQARSHSHVGVEQETHRSRPVQKSSHQTPAPLGPQSSLSSIASGGSDDSTGTVSTVATAASGGIGRGGPGFGGFGRPAPDSPPLGRGYDSPSRSDSLSSISSMSSMGLARFEGGMISSSPASSSIHSHAGSYTGSGSGSVSGSVASLTGSTGSGSGGSASGSHHGSLGSNASVGLGLYNTHPGYNDGRLEEIKVLEEEATPVHKDRLELPPASDLHGNRRERDETAREPGSPGFLSTRKQSSGHRTRRSWSPSVGAGLGLSGLSGASSRTANANESSTSRSTISTEEQEWLTALEELASRADASSSVEYGVIGGISAAARKSRTSNRNESNPWNIWNPWIPVPTTKLLQRKVCLEMLGWGFVMRERDGDWDALESGTDNNDHVMGLKDVIRRWELYGLMDVYRGHDRSSGTGSEVDWDGHARAACWLALMGKYEAAAQCLMRSGDESHHMMSGTIIALAPFCAIPQAQFTSTSTPAMNSSLSSSSITPTLIPNLTVPANLTPTPTRTQLPTVHNHISANQSTTTLQSIAVPRLAPALRDHYTKLTNKMQDPYLKLLLTHMTQLALEPNYSTQNNQNNAGTATSIYAFPGPVASSGLSASEASTTSTSIPTRTPLLHVLESPEMQTYLPFRERLAMAFAFLDDQGVTEYLKRIWEVCRPDSDGYTHHFVYGQSDISGEPGSTPGSGVHRSRSRASSSQSLESSTSIGLRRRKSWDGVGGGGTDVNVSGNVRKGSLSRTSTRENIQSGSIRASEGGNESQGERIIGTKSRKGKDTMTPSQTMQGNVPPPQPQHVGGDIDALIVVGAGTLEGREVLRRWVDRVGDVQSAAMLGWLGACVGVFDISAGTSRGRKKGEGLNLNGFSTPRGSKVRSFPMDRQVEKWVEAYRDFLDGLRMFHSRVEFDIARGEVLRGAILQSSNLLGATPYPLHEPLVPRQILIRCNYCNKSIVPPSQTTTPSTVQAQVSVSGLGLNLGTAPTTGQTRGHSNQASTGNGTGNEVGGMKKSKPTVCPSCKRSLPRCSVCLMTLGIIPDAVREAELDDASAGGRIKDTMDEAVIICQTCRHGGHASHILEWFFGADDDDASERDDIQGDVYSRLGQNGDGTSKTTRTCPVADCNCRCADEM